MPRVCSSTSALAELEFQCLVAVCSVWYLFSSRAYSSDSGRLQSVSSWLMCSLVLSQGCSRNPHVDFWRHPFCIVASFPVPRPMNSSQSCSPELGSLRLDSLNHHAWLRLHFPVGKCARLRAAANVVHTSCAASCLVSENSSYIFCPVV